MTTLSIQTPRWAVPLLAPGLRYRLARGGRGSGKSHTFAELMIKRCISSKVFCVCIREVQKSLSQSSKQLLESKINSLNLKHMFEVQRDKIICLSTGSVIIFMGLQNHTADSIKSIEGVDIVWIEEAQSISQFSLDILRPTIRKQGSEIWATWNPRKETDAIEALHKDPMPNTCCVLVNYTDNPWFSQTELVDEMEYDRGRPDRLDRYNHIWLGAYSMNSRARVFNNWAIEEFDAPVDTMFKFGADWGFAVDPSVLIRCYIVGKRLYIDHEAHQHDCEIDNLPLLFNEIEDSNLFPICGDSSRPETISYLKKHGFPKLYKSKKGPGSIEEGVEWLKSFQIIVHPRCTHTIDELQNYCYKIDKETDKVTGVFADKKNHVIDALRYACEAARMIDTKVKVKQAKPQRNYYNGRR